MNRGAIIFAREPVAGQVKTRLASALGELRAAQLYQAFLDDCVESACAMGVPVTIALTPESSLLYASRRYPALHACHQRGADLGERMAEALERAFAAGYDEAVIFGSDSPTATTSARKGALAALGPAKVALAPDSSGGFWALAAAAGTPLRWLAGERWGDPGVLSRIRAKLLQAGISYALSDLAQDIDTAEDLARLKDELLAHDVSVIPATHTRALLFTP